MFVNALTAVATMLILMGVGCFFAWKGYLTEEGNRLLSALVIRAALPGTILSTMLTTFTRGELLGFAYLLIVPASNMLIWAFAARRFAKLLRVPAKRQGVFTALCAFSNTVFIGFPVVRAVIGEMGMPYATAYYLANTTMFWVVGVGEIQRDGINQPTAAVGFGRVIVTTLKRLISPPFVTLVISIMLILIGAALPAPIMNAASSIGGLVTPLSMIFIGSMLFKALRGGFKWERGFGALLLVRYMLAPALTLASCLLLGVRGLPAQVFVLQTSMATMTQVAIIAHGYGADGEYASLGVAASTLGLMIALPLIALALPLI